MRPPITFWERRFFHYLHHKYTLIVCTKNYIYTLIVNTKVYNSFLSFHKHSSYYWLERQNSFKGITLNCSNRCLNMFLAFSIFILNHLTTIMRFVFSHSFFLSGPTFWFHGQKLKASLFAYKGGHSGSSSKINPQNW